MTVNQAAVQPTPDAPTSVNVTSDFAAMSLSDEANENSQNENVENEDEEHECTEECGFCEDEEGMIVIFLTGSSSRFPKHYITIRQEVDLA